MMKTPLYLIAGPTASGKSSLAIGLARRMGGCIINADAMQIYQGLPHLTAQPSDQDRAVCPHALYAMVPPEQRFSVALWRDLASLAIQSAAAAGQTPIVVGGTGLYFKALLSGLAPIPTIPDSVRERATALYDALGPEAFRERLAALDPASANRIKPRDRARLIRAYEVAVGTGKPMDHWHKLGAEGAAFLSAYTVKPVFLCPPRATLYAACDTRFLHMMNRGAVDEVRALLAQNLDPTLPAMKILGVPEIAGFLSGAMTKDDAIAKAQQVTRNYAKRQVTWFKNQWRDLGATLLTAPDLPSDL